MKLYKLVIISFSLLLCIQQDTIGIDYADESIDSEMYEAIEKFDVPKVADLLNKGADPNSKSIWGETNLGYAILRNKKEIVELLLSKGANPDLMGDAGSDLPLIYAICNKNIDIVKLLLKYKANASYHVDYHDSPIKYAQMILGYPSLDGSCHPIVALLFKHMEEIDGTNAESTEE